ncbi:MAG: hypothetical protein JWN70_4343 [Planctomycetaceae bacterium]|nr:hypothetical protein [Planctomycetaceae bacterium]
MSSNGASDMRRRHAPFLIEDSKEFWLCGLLWQIRTGSATLIHSAQAILQSVSRKPVKWIMDGSQENIRSPFLPSELLFRLNSLTTWTFNSLNCAIEKPGLNYGMPTTEMGACQSCLAKKSRFYLISAAARRLQNVIDG